MKFVLYKDADGLWRWRLVTSNGRTVADSGEGYASERAARHGIGLVLTVNKSTPVQEAA